MNIPDYLTTLIQKLVTKTKERRLTWSQTSRPNEYKCSFRSGVFVTIDLWFEEGYNITNADFIVYNDSGVQVDRLAFAEGSQEYNVLTNLHNEVYKSITKADETYDNLFGELDNL